MSSLLCLRHLFSKSHITSWLPVLLLTFIALLIRLNRLGHYSLWLDETIQYTGSTYPLPELYQSIFPQEMPLSFFIGKTQNFFALDKNTFELRLGSAIAGTSLVPIIYLVAIRLFNRQTAFMSAVITAMLPCLVQYSQEYRMYSYFALLSAITSFFAIRVLQKPNVLVVCGISIASLLTIYIHFLGAVSVVSIYLFFTFAALLCFYQEKHLRDLLRRGGTLICITCVVSAGSILTIPMWVRFFSDEYVPDQRGMSIFGAISTIFGDYIGVGHEKVFGLFLMLAIIGLIAAVPRKPQAAIYMLLCIGFPLTVFAIKGSGRIMLSNRYLIFLYPTYVMAIAYGATTLSEAAYSAGRFFFLRMPRQFVFQAATAVGMMVILVGPLRYLYSHNIKPIPANLKAAYDTLLDNMGSEDLLLEAATEQGGSPYYFRFYDSYFLRKHKFVRPGLIDDFNLKPWLQLYGDKERRLWILLTVSSKDQKQISETPNADFSVKCFNLICLFKSKEESPPNINGQLGKFFAVYAGIDKRFERLSAERRP